jgi:hypothetical protein
MIACSIGLIAFTTVGQTRDQTGEMLADTLEPVAVVRLSGVGFRKVLLERNELLECRELAISKDKRLRLMEMRVDVKNSQIGDFELIRETHTRQVKSLKRMVWKKNFEIWGWRVLSGVLVFKILRSTG